MDINSLLALLGDGQFHSGESLGVALGVSRTAVWKQLQKLEELGLTVESVKGQGYRLAGGIELLSRERIQAGLSVQAADYLAQLDIENLCPSTNLQAMAWVEAGHGAGYVCLAEYQSAGRGRRGRQWVSPYGSNIYMSVVAEFQGGVAQLEGLSLAVGVALVRALNQLDVAGVELKWPNDVLCQGRKLAGILLEMTGDVTGACQVVVGVGLNFRMPQAAAAGIDQPWIDLTSVSPELSRNELVIAVLNQLLPLLASYAEDGFVLYRKPWEGMHAYQNQKVAMHQGNSVISGKALGVTATGALILDVDGQLQEFSGGEVSLRGLP